VALAGLLVGVGLAVLMRSLFFFSPLQIHFVPWSGPGVPPGAEVLVQASEENKQALIEATLQTYVQHVLDKRAGEKPAPVLYVTTGSEKMSKFQGLIACQQRLKDSGNDCESSFFASTNLWLALLFTFSLLAGFGGMVFYSFYSSAV